MATFGYTTIGASTSTIGANTIGGNMAVLSENGLVSSITVRVSSGWGVGENAKCGIFDSSGNYLNHETQAVSGPQSDASWVTFNFASPVSLSAGTYGLGFFASATIVLAADLGSSGHIFDNAGQTYPTWPASVTHTSTNIKSIYATYSTEATYTADINAGSLNLSGINILAICSRLMNLSAGSFTLTGINVATTYARALIASVGQFVLTGIDAILRYSNPFTNEQKHSTSFTNITKNATSMTNQSKNATSFTNIEKEDGTIFINQSKNATTFTNQQKS